MIKQVQKFENRGLFFLKKNILFHQKKKREDLLREKKKIVHSINALVSVGREDWSDSTDQRRSGSFLVDQYFHSLRHGSNALGHGSCNNSPCYCQCNKTLLCFIQLFFFDKPFCIPINMGYPGFCCCLISNHYLSSLIQDSNIYYLTIT